MSLVGPGFPGGGCERQNPKVGEGANLIFDQFFFRKMNRKEKKWTGQLMDTMRLKKELQKAGLNCYNQVIN